MIVLAPSVWLSIDQRVILWSYSSFSDLPFLLGEKRHRYDCLSFFVWVLLCHLSTNIIIITFLFYFFD
jgi:hypothetical protein